MMDAAATVPLHRCAQQGCQRESARTAAVEQPWMIEADAGEGETRACGVNAVADEREIAIRMMRRIVDEHDLCEVRCTDLQMAVVEVAPDVAIDDQEGIAAK